MDEPKPAGPAADGAEECSVGDAERPQTEPARVAGRRTRGGELGREGLGRLSVPAGLCSTCAFLEVQASARSAFVRCGRSDGDPRFARYPRLPVLACPGFRAEGGESSP